MSTRKTPHTQAANAEASILACTNLESIPEPFQALINAARTSPNRAVIKEKVTAERSGYSRSTLWRDVKAGVFPPPIKLSERSVAWIDAEVHATLAAKALNTRSRQKVDLKRFVSLLIAT
jgi:predicted DNA-binding transcriptional regulator AlpA